jgi:hypothetical protein
MKTKYLIYNITNNTYFLGSNPDPIFGSIENNINPVLFDTEQKALNRLVEEINSFPTFFNY